MADFTIWRAKKITKFVVKVPRITLSFILSKEIPIKALKHVIDQKDHKASMENVQVLSGAYQYLFKFEKKWILNNDIAEKIINICTPGTQASQLQMKFK